MFPSAPGPCSLLIFIFHDSSSQQLYSVGLTHHYRSGCSDSVSEKDCKNVCGIPRGKYDHRYLQVYMKNTKLDVKLWRFKDEVMERTNNTIQKIFASSLNNNIIWFLYRVYMNSIVKFLVNKFTLIELWNSVRSWS